MCPVSSPDTAHLESDQLFVRLAKPSKGLVLSKQRLSKCWCKLAPWRTQSLCRTPGSAPGSPLLGGQSRACRHPHPTDGFPHVLGVNGIAFSSDWIPQRRCRVSRLKDNFRLCLYNPGSLREMNETSPSLTLLCHSLRRLFVFR